MYKALEAKVGWEEVGGNLLETRLSAEWSPNPARNLYNSEGRGDNGRAFELGEVGSCWRTVLGVGESAGSGVEGRVSGE